jgi:hypothetical protein
LQLELRNHGELGLTVDQIFFDRNPFGLAVDNVRLTAAVPAGNASAFDVPIVVNRGQVGESRSGEQLAIALKADRPSPIFFACPFACQVIFVAAEEGGRMTRGQFIDHCKSIGNDQIVRTALDNAAISTAEGAKDRLPEFRLFFMARAGEEGFFTAKTVTGEPLVASFVFGGSGHVEIILRLANPPIANLVVNLLRAVLTTGYL